MVERKSNGVTTDCGRISRDPLSKPDTNGNLTSLTTYQSGVLGGAGAATTTWGYDPNSGLLTNQTYADGTSDGFQYNSAGQMTSLTEPGVTGSFGYDAYGNVINSSYVDSTSGLVQSVVTQQDDLGRPVVTSNTDNGKTFTTTDAYTTLGDLQSETFSSAGNASVNYAYYPTSSYGTSGSPDAAWSVAVNTPGGQSASQVYTYNSNTHRLRWITFNGSVKANYAYVNDSNQIASLSVGNVITTYVPDASDGSRLGSMSVSAAGQVIYSAAYTYNADGQRASDQITQTVAANDGTTTSQSQTLTYTYDPNQANALTQVTDGNGNVLYGFSYDGAGNFTSNGSLGSVNSVNEYSNLTYNLRHDLTNDGNYTYGYDAMDRLISVTPNYPSTGSSEAEYGYDGQGRMAWENVYNWAGSTTYHFVWSGSELVAKLDANNNLLQQYTWGPGQNGIDQVLLLTNYSGSTGTSYTLTYDASGNVIMMENALTEAVVANYTYTPYGALVYSTGPDAGISPWQGKGYWTDAAVDRAIAWAQPDTADGTTRTVYLPGSCWMQDDPTGISGGLNLKSVDGNDPINYIDPNGTSAFPFGSYLTQWASNIGRKYVDPHVVSAVRWAAGPSAANTAAQAIEFGRTLGEQVDQETDIGRLIPSAVADYGANVQHGHNVVVSAGAAVLKNAPVINLPIQVGEAVTGRGMGGVTAGQTIPTVNRVATGFGIVGQVSLIGAGYAGGGEGAASIGPAGRVAPQVTAAESAEAEAAQLQPYGGPGGGHHVPAKGAFTGAAGYDANAALAVPNAELARLGVDHGLVTGGQMIGYKAFAQTGATLSWEAVEGIETQALIRGGMQPSMARATAQQGIQALKDAGVSGPTRIPWGG